MRQKGADFPLTVKLQLKAMRTATNAILPIIKKDKYAPNVRSAYNINYTKYDDPLRQFDWHCPVSHFNDGVPNPTPIIFYIHGGAWSSADKHIYTRLCKDLCERGFVVINLNYRLMPEHRIENTYQDCLSCIRFCLRHAKDLGIDASQVVLAGDSAGAHLGALIAGKVTSGKLTLNCNIQGNILLYGLYDMFQMKDSRFYILPPMHEGFKKEKGENLNRFYRNFSPITYVTPNFPPSFLSSGKVDSLHPQTAEFLKVLKHNDIPVRALIFPAERKDARHAFINLNNAARHSTVMSIGVFLEEFVSRKKQK